MENIFEFVSLREKCLNLCSIALNWIYVSICVSGDKNVDKCFTTLLRVISEEGKI